jgi:hypothetical protein
MKSKMVKRKKKQSPLGSPRMKAIVNEIRKRYGPMLKRLAN